MSTTNDSAFNVYYGVSDNGHNYVYTPRASKEIFISMGVAAVLIIMALAVGAYEAVFALPTLALIAFRARANITFDTSGRTVKLRGRRAEAAYEKMAA